jgi:hypothetical protein
MGFGTASGHDVEVSGRYAALVAAYIPDYPPSQGEREIPLESSDAFLLGVRAAIVFRASAPGRVVAFLRIRGSAFPWLAAKPGDYLLGTVTYT